MKSIGQRGSSTDYTIFNENHFIHQGATYEQDTWNGRCYREDESSGFYTRAAREGGMVRKRISVALFNQLYNECEVRISEAVKESAV